MLFLLVLLGGIVVKRGIARQAELETDRVIFKYSIILHLHLKASGASRPAIAQVMYSKEKKWR
jgi:hypothetical protein